MESIAITEVVMDPFEIVELARVAPVISGRPDPVYLDIFYMWKEADRDESGHGGQRLLQSDGVSEGAHASHRQV